MIFYKSIGLFRNGVYILTLISLFFDNQSFAQGKRQHHVRKHAYIKKSNSEGASLSIYIEDSKNNDTLTLFFWPNVLSENASINEYLPHIEEKSTMNNQGLFNFKIINIDSPGYFTLSKERDGFFGDPIPIFLEYLVEPGDSIRIDMKKNDSALNERLGSQRNVSGLNDKYKDFRLHFSGKGAAKYQCWYRADTACALDTSAYYLFDKTGKFISDNHYDNSLKISLKILDNYKKQVSPIAYHVMRADFVGKFGFEKCDLFNWRWYTATEKKDTLSLQYLSKIYKEHFLIDPEIKNEENAKALSYYYSSYAMIKARIYENIKNGSPANVYSLLKREHTGELRDKVLTIYLLRRFKLVNGLQGLLNDALKTIKTDYCLNQLKELNRSQSRWEPAYNFSLPDTSGKIVTLKDYRGKVVFMDFWFTGCTSCSGYYQYQVSKVEREFENNPDVVFISISIDRARKMWMNSIYSGEYTSATSSNVINLYTGGEGDENVIIKHYKIAGYPTPLLIDRNGNIFSNAIEGLGTGDKLTVQIKNVLNVKLR